MFIERRPLKGQQWSEIFVFFSRRILTQWHIARLARLTNHHAGRFFFFIFDLNPSDIHKKRVIAGHPNREPGFLKGDLVSQKVENFFVLEKTMRPDRRKIHP